MAPNTCSSQGWVLVEWAKSWRFASTTFIGWEESMTSSTGSKNSLCLLCQLDAVECSDDVKAPAYYLVGKNAPDDIIICPKHESLMNMAVMVVGVATRQMDVLLKAVRDHQKPKLRVVPSPSNGLEKEE
jgi:hypothetical protein